MRSMFQTCHLLVARSCASLPDDYFSVKSYWMLSTHLRFGLPLLFFPSTSIIILPKYPSYPLAYGPTSIWGVKPSFARMVTNKCFVFCPNICHICPNWGSTAPPDPPSHTPMFLSLITCPYQSNLLSCAFLDISSTFVVPLIPYSIQLCNSKVNIHLDIQISATFNFFSCSCLGPVHH